MVEEGFVDVWRERHPTERAYTWFNRAIAARRGTRGQVLVCSDLVRRLRTADILDPLPWSGHLPVVIEL